MQKFADFMDKLGVAVGFPFLILAYIIGSAWVGLREGWLSAKERN